MLTMFLKHAYLFISVNHKALENKRSFQPRAIQLRDIHALLQIYRVNFNQHQLFQSTIFQAPAIFYLLT